jgi:hypothetical protein
VAAAFGGLPVLALVGYVFLPGRSCKLTLMGDEGEGECLALIASRIPSARCRVLDAISDEIRGANNDVVLSEGLGGFVTASACDDIALLWIETAQAAPAHARELVAAALTACRTHVPFSLGVARTKRLLISVSPPDILNSANRSRCRRSGS